MATKPKYYPCDYEGCGHDAIGCYRPDVDIKGLCFCADHRNDVLAAYTVLMTSGDEAMCNALLGRKSRKRKRAERGRSADGQV